MAPVALRKESVDRNAKLVSSPLNGRVALRKESVDRNKSGADSIIGEVVVALRKESVDRNRSSIKRAICRIVALRKESVDRNIILTKQLNGTSRRSPQGEHG